MILPVSYISDYINHQSASDNMLTCVALWRSSVMSAFSRPPSAVKNFRPLLLNGMWEAVSMMAPSYRPAGFRLNEGPVYRIQHFGPYFKTVSRVR